MNNRPIRYLFVAILSWVGISGICEAVAIPLAPLHKTPWYWIPAYVSHAIMVVGAILVLKWSKLEFPRLTLLPTGRTLFAKTAFYFAILGILFGILQPTINVHAAFSTGEWIPGLLWLVFEAGIVGWTEEFLYRGTLQRLLNKAFANQTVFGTRVGVVLAAILFSIGHLGNVVYQSLGVTTIQAAGAFVIGYWLGRYYDRTGDLAGAAWLHNMMDGLMFVVPWVLAIR